MNFKKILSKELHSLAKKLIEKNSPRVVAVVGSVGKTSTKNAIGKTLSKYRSVRYTKEGYNSDLGLPLSVFNIKHPNNLKNIFAWGVILFRCQSQVWFGKQFDIMISEIGIQSPGEIDEYLEFLNPEVVVVTSVSAEHMETMNDMDTVAKEELKAVKVADKAFINSDDVDEKFVKKYCKGNLSKISYYGSENYTIKGMDTKGTLLDMKYADVELPNLELKLISENYIKSITVAAQVATYMGYSQNQVQKAIKTIKPTSGRMNVFDGLHGSTIIDDSYNSSPLALVSALNTLSSFEANRRIAVLGNINEMGEYAEEGYSLPDMSEVDFVLTIGEQARELFGVELEKQKFEMKNFRSFVTPVQAGEYLQKFLTKGDLVLVKGSQGQVFSEETVKLILAHAKDEKKLVRQSKFWMKQKQYMFEPGSSTSDSTEALDNSDV